MGVTAQLRKMNLGDNLGSQSEEHTPSVLKKFVKKKTCVIGRLIQYI